MAYDELSKEEIHILASKARQRVADYYGSAMYSGFPAAEADLIDEQCMSDIEVIKIAQRLGLI